MAALPEPLHSTLRAIERAVEAEADDGFRAHLGASVIGRPCERAGWYTFRWATRATHSGRILRLFARGQREEQTLVELLRKAGVEVHDQDGAGQQFRVSAIGGHFGGSLDGCAIGLVEAPEKWHVLEFKTHNDKSFAKLVKEGVERAKPEHYAQMQVYMALTGMDRAFYLAVNKNDDSLHGERVRFDQGAADALMQKAQRIIASDRPPARLSEDPAWYECKFCDHRLTCHAGAVPPPSCRTCIHATPELYGEGVWSCARHQVELTHAEQLAGCPSHAYIPDLLAFWAEPIDAHGSSVEYRNKLTDRTFLNGPDDHAYSSAEIHAAQDLAMVGARQVDDLKKHSAPALLADGERLEWKMYPGGQHLGLYRHGRWIRWVPQTPEWLTLVERQEAAA